MSSEMRVTDAMVEAALDGLDNACMDIAKRELQPHDVLWRGFSRMRRMEAMRAALNAALLARTEAVADGDKAARDLYVRWVDSQDVHCNRFPSWQELSDAQKQEWRAKLSPFPPRLQAAIDRVNTRPQDASGDAEDAARWRHVRKDGLIWRVNMLALAKDDIDILFGAKADAAVDEAMQAKEAK